MPKITLLDMPLAEQAQMLAARRRARYGYLRAGMAFCPQEPHRLGGHRRPADERTTALRQGRMVPRPRERRPRPLLIRKLYFVVGVSGAVCRLVPPKRLVGM